MPVESESAVMEQEQVVEEGPTVEEVVDVASETIRASSERGEQLEEQVGEDEINPPVEPVVDEGRTVMETQTQTAPAGMDASAEPQTGIAAAASTAAAPVGQELEALERQLRATARQTLQAIQTQIESLQQRAEVVRAFLGLGPITADGLQPPPQSQSLNGVASAPAQTGTVRETMAQSAQTAVRDTPAPPRSTKPAARKPARGRFYKSIPKRGAPQTPAVTPTIFMERVVDYLSQHGQAAAADLGRAAKIAPNSATIRMQALRDQGIVKQNPKTKAWSLRS